MKERKKVERKGISDEFKMLMMFPGVPILAVGIATGASICTAANEENKYFEYSVTEFGDYIASGTVKFEDLKKCYFVEIQNDACNNHEFYICRSPIYSQKKYINILNNEVIFEADNYNDLKDKNSDRNIINKIEIGQYLYGFEQIKAEYTADDVKQILEKIKTSVTEKEDKVLVKSTFNKYFTKVNL